MSLLHHFVLLLAAVLGIFTSTGQRKILGALPIGSSQKDVDRFSRALKHYKLNFHGTVDWALFHYQDIDVWKSQPWYNKSNIVLSISELEFAYYYFYKYLTPRYITNLYEYDWIWLLVSDCDFDVFDAQIFVDFLELWNPGIAQPANTGRSVYKLVRRHAPSHVRVTNFIEIGPLLSIRVQIWESFRGRMNPRFNSGWGVDRILCTYVAKNHGYTLDPFNQTDLFATPPATVYLSAYSYFNGGSRVPRDSHRLCPDPLSFNPACLVVDASPLKHLDFHEGIKSGLYKNAWKDVKWYREMYKDYFIFKIISYCTSSETNNYNKYVR